MHAAQMRDALVLAVEGGEDRNPLIPALYDIIWGTLSFAIILAVFVLRVWPRMKEIEAKRVEGIEAKLERAERDRAEAESLLAQYREQLQEARQDASRIRAEAQSERKGIVEQARAEAQEAGQQVADRTHAQLQADLAQARTELSREVGRLAVDLAGKVVVANLDDTDRTRATVDRFLDDLEASTRRADGAGGADRPRGGASAVATSTDGPR